MSGNTVSGPGGGGAKEPLKLTNSEKVQLIHNETKRIEIGKKIRELMAKKDSVPSQEIASLENLDMQLEFEKARLLKETSSFKVNTLEQEARELDIRKQIEEDAKTKFTE